MAAVMRAAPAEPAPERKPSPAAPEALVARRRRLRRRRLRRRRLPEALAAGKARRRGRRRRRRRLRGGAPSPVPKPAAAAGKPKLKFVIKNLRCAFPRRTRRNRRSRSIVSEPSTNPRPREANDGGARPSRSWSRRSRRRRRRRFPETGPSAGAVRASPRFPRVGRVGRPSARSPTLTARGPRTANIGPPAGPMGTWKTFMSCGARRRFCQFLKADAAQSDSVFGGLTMEFFNCKPFTRKTFFRRTRAGARADPSRPLGRSRTRPALGASWRRRSRSERRTRRLSRRARHATFSPDRTGPPRFLPDRRATIRVTIRVMRRTKCSRTSLRRTPRMRKPRSRASRRVRYGTDDANQNEIVFSTTDPRVVFAAHTPVSTRLFVGLRAQGDA